MGLGFDPLSNFDPQPDQAEPMPEDVLAQLGLGPPPTQDPIAQEPFQPSGYESFLERLSPGLQNVQFNRPRNFGEGLVQGLTGSFATAGQRVAHSRSKFEAAQATRQAQADADHRKATQEYNDALAKGKLELAKEKRLGQGPVMVDEQMATDNPAFRPYVGRDVPQGTYNRLASAKPPSPGSEPLVAIQTPRGPVLVRRSEAEGEVPASAVGAELTPEQAAVWAAFARATGVLPQMGRAGVASPAGQAITNAMMNDQPGTSPQDVGSGLAGSKGTYAATSAALRDIEKSLSQQTVFTNKLKKNTDRLRQTATKVVDLGPQFLNGPIRNALGQLGSAEQAAYSAALLPVVTESSRLLTSGPALGGQLTDSAQKELRSIISGNFNAAQLTAVLDILENDANNGITAYTNQRNDLKARLSGKPETPAGTPGTTYKPGGFFDSNRPKGR